MAECEQVIRELQESQVSLSDRLAQQKQQLIGLCGTSYILDPDFGNLQDTKDRVRRTYIPTYIQYIVPCTYTAALSKNANGVVY